MNSLAKNQVKLKIWIRGHIDPDWSEWFAGLKAQHTPEGNSLLFGLIQDQAAFFGCINRIRDLGVSLIKIEANFKGGWC